jgi:hypothetical protein
MFPVILLVLSLAVGVATGIAIDRAVRGQGLATRIAGGAMAVVGIYAVLLIGNVYSLYQLFEFFHAQVLGTGWIASPYLVKALVGILAFGGYALIPTLTLSFLRFSNRKFAVWAAIGYCSSLLLLYALSPHDKMVCRDATTGEFLCTYGIDARMGQITLYPKDTRYDPITGQKLELVDEEILQRVQQQREAAANPRPQPAASPSLPKGTKKQQATLPPPATPAGEDNVPVSTALRATKKPAKPRLPSFETLNPKVESLRFFESDAEGINSSQHNYRDVFGSAGTRYIGWEVNFSYPQADRRIDFTINDVVTRPDGTVDHQSQVSCFVQPGWTSSECHAGWGNSDGQYWQQPGTYTVVLSVNGRQIANGAFSLKTTTKKKTKK